MGFPVRAAKAPIKREIMSRLALLLLVAALGVLPGAGADPPAEPFPPIVNTQNPKDVPPTPAEELRLVKAPPGFQVTLFAGDPDVRQPISMCLDDRGRLWVAECYSYTGHGWDQKLRDRILIFEDTGGDGRFDKRTVFWDGAHNLTSIAVGFGGVWALCAPNLLFIPDRNGDDVPDGAPQVVLDGWALRSVGHNIVNGLTWGPDGWLYGRHGILETSVVGPPGTPPNQRVRINTGIWRYHPTRKVFEAVAHGTTNPWGLDYDDHGQMFFTNNVIGHLWHVIPGAHYKRMYGEDLDPHVYDLIDQHADHYHWDTGKSWTDSRDAKGKNDLLGGGHSHCGGMIYLGDNWPQEYRDTIFMCNTHGRRINNDRLERAGSGYVGRHRPDFLKVGTPWFRGTELRYGPDGGVYFSDWCDLGECHDSDGVHRTSGRIFKVTYGQAARPTLRDVARLSDAELAQLQLHRNDYFVRAARRNLQERAAAGHDMKAVHAALQRMLAEQRDVTRQLRALWALFVTGGTDETMLRKLLASDSEHLRVWAIKLLVDGGPPGAAALADFVRLGRQDPSGLVRLFLASALQRLPAERRGDLAEALLSHGEDAADHNLPLMCWYGIEPLVSAQPARAVELAGQSRIPLVRRFIARRLGEDIEKAPGPVNALLQRAAEAPPAQQVDVLHGLVDALRGWRKARPPAAWAVLQSRLSSSPNQEVRDLARELGVVFGDGRALSAVRRTVLDGSASGEARRAALKALLDARPPDLLPLLKKLVVDRATASLAMRGLAAFDDPGTPALILQHYGLLRAAEKPEAINTLVSRPAYARVLLQAVARGQVPRTDLSAFHARQIRSFKDEGLNRQLTQVWGEVRDTPVEKRKLIARYKGLLTPARLKHADLGKGRLVFNQTCATCHTLYGQGKSIGPDLTGANRDNLDYLLENVLDPSAVVAADFRLSVVVLKDGRVLTGIVGGPPGPTLSVQTQTDKVKVDRTEVEEVRPTTLSLMPDGLWGPLSDEQVRDLVGYLMSRQQVPLPGAGAKR
jgi:putative membrane-bound dehydrogenase-like protein